MEVLRDDRPAKVAEASRRTAAVEVTPREAEAATLHLAVGVKPKQHRAAYLLNWAKSPMKMASGKIAACDCQ